MLFLIFLFEKTRHFYKKRTNYQFMVEQLLQTVYDYFRNILAGVAILFMGFALGIFAKKLVFRFLQEIEFNDIMRKFGLQYDLEKWISSVISYVIYGVSIVLFLEQLKIKSTVLYIVVGAILMLLILTFIVGLKDVIPNFVAWIVLQRRGTIYEGKTIEVREIYGVVERVGYLETEIKTEKGDILYVPNALFLKSKFAVKKL